MQIVDMKVHEVETARLLNYGLQHQDVIRERIDTASIEPQRPITEGDQAGLSH
jgi:hypothetical protein